MKQEHSLISKLFKFIVHANMIENGSPSFDNFKTFQVYSSWEHFNDKKLLNKVFQNFSSL